VNASVRATWSNEHLPLESRFQSPERQIQTLYRCSVPAGFCNLTSTRKRQDVVRLQFEGAGKVAKWNGKVRSGRGVLIPVLLPLRSTFVPLSRDARSMGRTDGRLQSSPVRTYSVRSASLSNACSRRMREELSDGEDRKGLSFGQRPHSGRVNGLAELEVARGDLKGLHERRWE
jgi:hypothetical protein